MSAQPGLPLQVHLGTPLADAVQEGARRVTILVDGAVAHDSLRSVADVEDLLRAVAEAQRSGSDVT